MRKRFIEKENKIRRYFQISIFIAVINLILSWIMSEYMYHDWLILIAIFIINMCMVIKSIILYISGIKNKEFSSEGKFSLKKLLIFCLIGYAVNLIVIIVSILCIDTLH